MIQQWWTEVSNDHFCRIAHILGILLMNSCNTDIFFSNHYHWQSVRFDLIKFIPVIFFLTIFSVNVLREVKNQKLMINNVFYTLL